MTSSSSVFLVGAGYIGRNVLDELLDAKYTVTTLVRRPEQALELGKTGARTVLGTLNDLELLAAQTAQHEIIINTSSCDDLPSVEAILSGIRQRANAGHPSTYIHTSGTGALGDDALGMYKSDKIYRDDVPEDIDALPSTSMHRHVDIPIVQAAREFKDKAKIAIILPPFVYGLNEAHQRHSFGLVALVRFAMKHGFSGHVGKGTNTWSAVHVDDLGSAYTTLLTHMRNSEPKTFLRNPYFFAENGIEFTMGEAAKHIGRVLYQMGAIQSPQEQTFSEDHYQDVFGPLTPVGLGCNSRSRAIRLRELGWEPKIDLDMWTSWEKYEIPSIVAALDPASGK